MIAVGVTRRCEILECDDTRRRPGAHSNLTIRSYNQEQRRQKPVRGSCSWTNRNLNDLLFCMKRSPYVIHVICVCPCSKPSTTDTINSKGHCGVHCSHIQCNFIIIIRGDGYIGRWLAVAGGKNALSLMANK